MPDESVTYEACFVENPNTGLRFISAFMEETNKNIRHRDRHGVVRNTIAQLIVLDQLLGLF